MHSLKIKYFDHFLDPYWVLTLYNIMIISLKKRNNGFYGESILIKYLANGNQKFKNEDIK